MNEGIKFGILHFLGISMFLSPVFTKLNVYIVMLTGLAVIGAGNFLLRIRAKVDVGSLMLVCSRKIGYRYAGICICRSEDHYGLYFYV